MIRSVPWHRRLSVRVMALFALLTLVAIGTLAFLVIRTQERHILAEAVRGANLVSETIRRSIHHHMLTDQRQDAYLDIENMGRQPGIRSIRMFNDRGAITFSTQRSDIGTVADRQGPTCAACHQGKVPLTPCPNPSHRILQEANGRRTLAVVTPIYNEPSCAAAGCHASPSTQRVLGVIGLGVSLDELDQSTIEISQQVTALAAIIFLVFASLGIYFMRRTVTHPVTELVKGTQRVAEADLDYVIPVLSRDELGLLATKFNAMTDSLRQTRQELHGLMAALEQKVEDRTAALRQAQDQLVQAEKMSSLGKLSASIAHEINNPLMGILTVAKLLIRTVGESTLSEKERAPFLRQLKMVQRETERCSTIVRNLLDFSRQRPLTLASLDVNAPLEEALSVAANQLALQETQLTKHLGADLLVRADFGQLRQAFLNIILNAVEAMGKGGKLEITSRRLEPTLLIVVEIADNGPGMPREILGKIFDPFFTTKEKGTGLGLSVVYGIVQRHGGKLDVYSRPGEGTRMRVILPIRPPERASGEEQAA